MSALIGDVYGPYRVIRPLGGGGMGTVLLAEDPRLGRHVALKTFTGGAAATPQAREHLLREARAAARLSHPNIATVHDVLEIAGETVIVFEYVEGETLAARLLRGRLPVADALRIGEQLADGLAAAHAQGVIHRDLKPSNVMLMPDGRAKILDFGIAHSLSLGTEETSPALSSKEGMYAGTPAYAAPEQWLGEPVGPHTDVFALGLVLFEMLGGRRPFEGHSRFTLMQQVLEAPRPHIRELNPSVPASVDALIDTMLAPTPSQRPATARDVANILKSIERDVTTTHTAIAPPPRKFHPWSIASIGLLIVLVGALVAMLQNRPPAPTPPPIPVVAVLPLTNSTGALEDDYVATGFAESLTTSLASFNGITVISRAGVLGVWSREKEPARIAKELGATYLIEGAIQKVGDRIRLSVNLVRPDRSVAWGESVEGLRDRMFELESRLAAALGTALSVQVSAAERAKLAQQPTNNADALMAYWRGRALLDRRDVKGNTDAALAAFDQAVRLDSAFAMAHAARGEALWARYLDSKEPGDAAAAVDAGTTALRLDPNIASVRYALALTLNGTGRPAEAIDELHRALALQPNFDDARVLLGTVLAEQGRWDEAIPEFRKAIALRPNFAGHYQIFGRTLLQAGRYKEAAEELERGVALQPDNYGLRTNLGYAYIQMGRTNEALQNWQKALEIQPSGQAYSNLGAVLHRKGDYQGAVDAYNKALEYRRNSHVTYRNLGDAYRRLGRERMAQEAYLRAIELAQRDLSVNPRDAGALSSLALYLQKTGRSAEALAKLDEARTLAPTNIDVLNHAAAVHALAGRPAAALDALAAAIAAGRNSVDAREDDDLVSLRSEPRFKALVGSPGGSGGPKQ